MTTRSISRREVLPASMSAPLSEADILFPSQQSGININQIGKQLKRSNLSVHNRLASIALDAEFVRRVAEHYKLPVLANERCGSWYIPPELKAGSAYFKSTDGHAGQWAFSLRRMNCQVLRVVETHGGCIIVDSTRRGKSMPDALSKTVPIWISVWNAALLIEPKVMVRPEVFRENGVWPAVLRTPQSIVSPSEYAQIEARLSPMIYEAFRDSGEIQHSPSTRMIPIWITPETAELPALPEDACPVILLTASSRTSPDITQENYVQGAADDAESWAYGLDAETFWQNKDEMLAASEESIPALVRDLVQKKRLNASTGRLPSLIKPTTNIWIANNAAAEQVASDYDVVICCDPQPSRSLEAKLKERYLHLECSMKPKIGSRDLRTQLPKLTANSSPLRGLTSTSRVLITCLTGKDLSVGVAVAVICLCVDERGVFDAGALASSSPKVMNKDEIKRRLAWIVISMPDASPSRATLQSINDFILG